MLRDCQHISAAQREAADLELDIDDEGVHDAAIRIMTSRLIRNIRSISYLPIAPPAWLQINGDQLKSRPFNGGIHLPDIFPLGDANRCIYIGTVLEKNWA